VPRFISSGVAALILATTSAGFVWGVRYRVAEKEITQYLSFEVQPTKMAMATDLEGIHREVDEFYPLWRFSFAQKNRPVTG
jgi:hypothetical protein